MDRRIGGRERINERRYKTYFLHLEQNLLRMWIVGHMIMIQNPNKVVCEKGTMFDDFLTINWSPLQSPMVGGPSRRSIKSKRS